MCPSVCEAVRLTDPRAGSWSDSLWYKNTRTTHLQRVTRCVWGQNPCRPTAGRTDIIHWNRDTAGVFSASFSLSIKRFLKLLTVFKWCCSNSERRGPKKGALAINANAKANAPELVSDSNKSSYSIKLCSLTRLCSVNMLCMFEADVWTLWAQTSETLDSDAFKQHSSLTVTGVFYRFHAECLNPVCFHAAKSDSFPPHHQQWSCCFLLMIISFISQDHLNSAEIHHVWL